jgi:fluoroacetyl-CoA thioesterase
MRPGLAIGARHVVRYTVPVHQTVPDLLPALAEFRRGQPVFATGFMVGLMEAPCMAAVYPHLEPGEVTLGTLINMTHLSASPPGTSLAAEARAIAVEGRSVRFAVVVADAAGEIAAAGEHGLRVVDVARFHDRLAAKQAQLPHPGSSPLPRDTNGPHHSHRTCQRQPDRSFPDDAPPVHPALNRRAIYSQPQHTPDTEGVHIASST